MTTDIVFCIVYSALMSAVTFFVCVAILTELKKK